MMNNGKQVSRLERNKWFHKLARNNEIQKGCAEADQRLVFLVFNMCDSLHVATKCEFFYLAVHTESIN